MGRAKALLPSSVASHTFTFGSKAAFTEAELRAGNTNNYLQAVRITWYEIFIGTAFTYLWPDRIAQKCAERTSVPL